jgi:hypothetical protein
MATLQIMISGAKRHTPEGARSMPASGTTYTDDEIAAVANDVTVRFGTKGSKRTAKTRQICASRRHNNSTSALVTSNRS